MLFVTLSPQVVTLQNIAIIFRFQSSKYHIVALADISDYCPKTWT